jgi:hypothetical protein
MRVRGSHGLSNNGLQPRPWFHENALLEVDGRGVVAAEDGAGSLLANTRAVSLLAVAPASR